MRGYHFTFQFRDTPISSPSRPAGARLRSDVIRTQSGSLIPQLSKQPTPAPTSPGSDHPGTPALVRDLFGSEEMRADTHSSPEGPDGSQAPEASAGREGDLSQEGSSEPVSIMPLCQLVEFPHTITRLQSLVLSRRLYPDYNPCYLLLEPTKIHEKLV